MGDSEKLFVTTEEKFEKEIRKAFDHGGVDALDMLIKFHRWWMPWRWEIKRMRRAVLDGSDLVELKGVDFGGNTELKI